jgi:hypothetical protein
MKGAIMTAMFRKPPLQKVQHRKGQSVKGGARTAERGFSATTSHGP